MTRKNEFSRLWHQTSESDTWSTDIEKARVELARTIVKALSERWGTAIAAERATGIAHTEFSRIRNGKLARYTVDRLARLLLALDPGLDVHVEVKVSRRRSSKKINPLSSADRHDEVKPR
jgi:hypothetical protein